MRNLFDTFFILDFRLRLEEAETDLCPNRPLKVLCPIKLYFVLAAEQIFMIATAKG